MAIQKLDIELTQSVATNHCIINKINELVGIVNEQQLRVDNIMCWLTAQEQKEKPADPYAEQRKWIGKLCRFRDNDADEWNYCIYKRKTTSCIIYIF